MSTNKTENYQLHKWEADDDFLRTEFNENFAAIDSALMSMDNALQSHIVTGTYTGDGTTSRTISLGFTPKAVLLMRQSGLMVTSNNYYHGGMALAGLPASYEGKETLAILEGGFRVSYGGASRTNTEGSLYYYLALK